MFHLGRRFLLHLVVSLFGCFCIFVYIPSRSVLFFRICFNLFLWVGLCVMMFSLVPRKICMDYFPWFWFLVLHRTLPFIVSFLLSLCVFLLPKLVLPVLCFSFSSFRMCFALLVQLFFFQFQCFFFQHFVP